MYFDRKKFFDGYRDEFGSLTQQQVTGLERLLTCIENDPHIKDVRWAAYMLGTVKRETAHTFTPIHEYGGRAYFIGRYGGQTRKGKELGNDTPEEGYFYAGKGDVQLTGEDNYEKVEAAIRREYPEVVKAWEKRTGKTFDLTVGDQPNDEKDPQNALDPIISYATMSYGMRTGLFTGKKLSDYIKGTTTDYRNARRIINGLDHAREIATVAATFEGILRNAKSNSAPVTATSFPPVSDQTSVNQPPSDQPVPKQPESGKEWSEGERPKPNVEIDQAENVHIDAPPPPGPKTTTVTVQKVRTSVWSKLVAGVAILTGMGINFGNIVQTRLNEMTLPQLGYVLGACVLIALALWFYERAQNRAHHKTEMLVATAADTQQNTVKLIQ